MTRSMTHLLALLTIITLVVPSADAQNIPADRVDARAGSIFHLDMAALRESTLGRHMLEHPEAYDIDMSEIEKIEEELDFNPLHDILAVTVYTIGDDEQPIVLLRTTEAADTALQRLQEKPEHYSSMDHGGVSMHSWTEPEHGEIVWFTLMRAEDRRERYVVMAESPDQVVAALHAATGEVDTLQQRDDDNLLVETSPGTVFYAATTETPWLPEGDDPASEILQHACHIVVQVGEHEKQTFIEALISTENDEEAQNVADILQGILALGRLIAAEDESLEPMLEVLRALRFETRDHDIQISFRYDAEALIAMMSSHSSEDD